MTEEHILRKNHPPGLRVLFFTEMWERFGYYGMRALLVLYMTKALLFDTEKAGSIYGWFTGLVYLTPLMGGYLADRYLGQRKSVVIGALLMALGYFILAVPHPVFFYLALGVIIFGNGFFKPNISTVVGQLYEPGDPRRDGAFTIFYMGINVGALASPLICGTLGENFGWQYGFVAAGVGMVAGLLWYLAGQKHLGDKGVRPAAQLAAAAGAGQKSASLTKEEKDHIFVIFTVVFFVIFFWSAFEQAGSSLTLFAERSTNRVLPIINWEFPASWFQAVNPLFIVALAPLFSRMWIRLAERKREPSLPVKMSIGLLLAALGFVVMVFAAQSFQASGPVSMVWLLAVYFVHTLGELCLSPVGLSMVSKLSPLRFTSLLMGVWLGSSFCANLIGGLFAGMYDKMELGTFFMVPIATAGAAGIILLLLTKPLKKRIHA